MFTVKITGAQERYVADAIADTLRKSNLPASMQVVVEEVETSDAAEALVLLAEAEESAVLVADPQLSGDWSVYYADLHTRAGVVLAKIKQAQALLDKAVSNG